VFTIVGGEENNQQWWEPRRLSEIIQSAPGKQVIQMKYAGGNLFVLHEDGILNRFQNFGGSAEFPNFAEFSHKNNPPVELTSKKANGIEAIYDARCEATLLFISYPSYVQVYIAYNTTTMFELISIAGYLSSNIAKKDFSTIDTTCICAKEEFIVLGNKTGNATLWTSQAKALDDNASGQKIKL